VEVMLDSATPTFINLSGYFLLKVASFPAGEISSGNNSNLIITLTEFI
jgi:hypothetical protein